MPLVVGLVHVALVAPHYFFGSFDDDSSYVLTAKALLQGQGLTGHIGSGGVVVGLYAPGFSALIAPLVWIWPHDDVPLRLFSAGAFSAVFPLTWVYLGRKGLGERVRVVALLMLALSPPMATFGSMVMAETTYLVVLLIMLILFDRWEAEARIWTANGVGVIAAAGALIWIKQAGIAFVAGMVIWLIWNRRQWGPAAAGLAKAAALAAGVFLLLLPVAVARLIAGVPLAGARYSSELGGFYHGGLLGRLTHVLPDSAAHLLSTAVPATLVPYLEPLPINDHWPDLWKALSWQVTILVVIGGVVWFRRYRDVTLTAVPLYLLECVLWPFVNERRAILIIPILVAWYAMGAAACWQFLRRRAAAPRQLDLLRGVAVAFSAAVVGVPLVAQMPRDYLFPWEVSSSHFQGSRYVKLMSGLGRHSDVVETDYLSSVALFSGHRTNWTAFQESLGDICYEPGVRSALLEDHASYLFTGDINKPGVLDNGCLSHLASTGTWAVELLHTAEDNATVWELIGPGTANPDLVDADLLRTPKPAQDGSTWAMEWDWGAPRSITQVSVGWAYLVEGPTTGVSLQLQEPGAGWVTVAGASSAVGDGSGDAPYLLAYPPAGTTASAMRVVAVGTAEGEQLNVFNAHALGPAAS